MDIQNLTNITKTILQTLSQWIIGITKIFSNGITAVKAVIVDASGNQITSFGSPSTVADYKIAGTYGSTGTLTFTLPGNLAVSSSAQIVYVREYDGTGHLTNVYVNGASGYSLGYSAPLGVSTISVYKDGSIVTSLTSGATYEVGVNSLLNSQLYITANAPMPMQPNYSSPYDFQVAYGSASTITVTGSSFDIDSSYCNIISLIIHKSDGTEVKYLTGNNGIVITTFELANSNITSPNTVRVYQNGVLLSPFTTSTNADIKYRLTVNYQQKSYDASTDTTKITMQNYPLQPVTGELLNAAITTVIAGDGITVDTTVTPSGAVKTVTINDGTAGTTWNGTYAIVVGGNNDCIVQTSGTTTITIVSIVNNGSGYTAATGATLTPVVINYYPSSDGLEIGAYRDFSLYYKTNTVTGNMYTAVEVSDEDTVPSLWFNATKSGYVSAGVQAGSSGINSILNENGKMDFDNINAKRVRIRTLTTVSTVAAPYLMYTLKNV